jgi:MFS family permease
VHPDGALRASAYSLESTLDELIFVLGPLIATVIATQVSPVLVLVLAGLLVGSGATLLSRLRDTDPPPRAVGSPAGRSALRNKGMVLVVLVSAAMGAIFASAEVTMVAFCSQRGEQALSGVVLAAFALGSASAGLLYGARTWRRSLLDRFRLQALSFAVLPPLLLAAFNVASLAVCAFVVGLGIAPTLITTFGLISRIVPIASLTEGLSWLTTGLNVGFGLSAAAVGRIADAQGARAAFSVTIGAGVLLGLLALRLHAVLREPEPVV